MKHKCREHAAAYSSGGHRPSPCDPTIAAALAADHARICSTTAEEQALPSRVATLRVQARNVGSRRPSLGRRAGLALARSRRGTASSARVGSPSSARVELPSSCPQLVLGWYILLASPLSSAPSPPTRGGSHSGDRRVPQWGAHHCGTHLGDPEDALPRGKVSSD